MKKNNRLIIADPSFEDWVGHHAPYDIAVLKAGEIQGSSVQVWAAKIIDADVSSYEGNILKIYSTSAWGRIYGAKRPIATEIIGMYAALDNRLRKPIARVSRSIVKPIVYVISQIVPPFVRRLIAQPAQGLIDFMPPVFSDALRTMYARTRASINKTNPDEPRVLVYLLRRLIPPFVKRMITRPGSWVRDLMPPFMTKIGAEAKERKFELIPKLAYVLFLKKSRSQYFETIGAIKKNNVNKGDTLFCHMVTGFNFLAWALIARFAQSRGIKVGVLFRYPVAFVPASRLDVRIALRIYEECAKSGCVSYYSDSKLLAEHYRGFLNAPVQTMPIPHLPDFQSKVLPMGGEKIVVAVLGNARAEKGFGDIVEAIKILAFKEGCKFEFHIQVNNPDEDAAPHVGNLYDVRSIEIHTYENALTEGEYASILERCQVVLAPYHAEVYEARTSGVLVEAIASAKIAIVTERTWLATELQEHGTGILVKNKSPECIAAALLHVQKNLQQLSENALVKANAYRQKHGGHNFLSCLLGSGKFETSDAHEALIVFPFPDFYEQKTGATIRTGLLCQYLISKGVQVSVVLPMQNIEKPHPRLDDVRFFRYHERHESRSYWRSLLGKQSLAGKEYRFSWYIGRSQGNLRNINFDRILNKALRPNTVVLVDYPFDVVNVKYMTRAYGNRICLTLLDLMGLFGTQEQLKSKALSLELKAARLSDRVVTVAKHESDFLKSLGIDNDLIPNPCVVSPEDSMTRIERPCGLKIQDKFVLFVGSNHLPNINAAIKLKALAKQLSETRTQVTVVIAGSCHEATAEDNFVSLGKVDDETLSYLNRNCLMVVCPLEDGTGASLKTIQAMGYEKIVLGTQDAFRGLNVTSLSNCIIEDDFTSYKIWITKIVASFQDYKHIESSAARFAESYDYRRVFNKYYDYIIESNASS